MGSNYLVIYTTQIIKRSKQVVSIDDRATRPNFEGYLLSFDKDTKFPNVLPIFKKG